MKPASLALLGVALAACTPMTPAASSSAVLTPERTWVIVAKPARPAALDVARLFQQRGFMLVDATTDDRGTTLRFKGERTTVAEQVVTPLDVLAEVADTVATDDIKHRHHHRRHVEATTETYRLGSVYYVRVEPRGETMTSISAIGRTTRDGVEACTPDTDLVAPCAPLAAGPSVEREIAGVAEAETINGVFAELRLSGAVVAPDAQAVEASQRCWQRRREVTAAAARVSDPRAKAGILRTAPTCEAVATN